MLIKVKDKNGEIFTMPSVTPKCILSIHYSTSYYQFIVQDYIIDEEGNERFPEKDIIVPINSDNWIDLIAVNDDEIGELITNFNNSNSIK